MKSPGIRLVTPGRWFFLFFGLITIGSPCAHGQQAITPSGPTAEELVAGALRVGSGQHAQSDFNVLSSNLDANRQELEPLVEAMEAGPAGVTELAKALQRVLPLIRNNDVDWSQHVGLDEPSGVRSAFDRSPTAAVNAAWVLCRSIAMTRWRDTENPASDADLGRKVAEIVCELLGTGWGDDASHGALRAIGEHSITPLLSCLRDVDQRRVVSAIDALLTQGYPGREAEVYAAAMALRKDGRRLLGPGQRIDTVGKHAEMLARQANGGR